VSEKNEDIAIPGYVRVYMDGWEMQESWRGEYEEVELRISTFSHPEKPEEIWTTYQFETYLNYHFHGAIIGAWKSTDREGELNTFLAESPVTYWDIECALSTARMVIDARERGEERTEHEIEYENMTPEEDLDDD
jgi:hypothetical protein